MLHPIYNVEWQISDILIQRKIYLLECCWFLWNTSRPCKICSSKFEHSHKFNKSRLILNFVVVIFYDSRTDKLRTGRVFVQSLVLTSIKEIWQKWNIPCSFVKLHPIPSLGCIKIVDCIVVTMTTGQDKIFNFTDSNTVLCQFGFVIHIWHYIHVMILDW